MYRRLFLVASIAFLLTPLAAPPALAQAQSANRVFGCNTTGSTGNSEIYVRVDEDAKPEGDVGLSVTVAFDYQGTHYTHTYTLNGEEDVFSDCDLQFITTEPAVNLDPNQGALSLPRDTPISFTFVDTVLNEPPAQFTYVACNDSNQTLNFYCASVSGSFTEGYGDLYFIHDAQDPQGNAFATVVHAVPNVVVGRVRLLDRYIDEVLGTTDWIGPYDMNTLCSASTPGCSEQWPTPIGLFVTQQQAPYTFIGDLTQYDNDDPDVRRDEWRWDLDGQTLSFQPGARIFADGELTVDGMALSAADPAAGWYGIWADGPGADLTLDGAALLGVSYDDGNDYKKPNSALTVTNGASALLTDGAKIIGAERAQGIEAVGALVTIEGAATEIRNNEYAGVVAMPNTEIFVRDRAQVYRNDGGGLVASGQGATIRLYDARIYDNDGPGVTSLDGGYVETLTNGTLSQRTEVDSNEGGLSATAGGSIQMGRCDGACLYGGHAITDNDPNDDPAVYDAQSRSSSLVRAENNDWAVGDAACLDLDDDASSLLLIEPLIANGPTCGGFGSGVLRSGSTAAAGKSGGVLLTMLDAEDALAEGDAATAGALLVSALGAASTPDERRGVYGGVRRVLALAQPAGLVADLTARLDGADRPDALHALAVAALAMETAEAEGYAAALSTEYAGTEHEPVARSLLARIAAGDGDEAGTLGHLEALWTLEPESDRFVQSAAVALAAFPDLDLDWTGIAFKGGPDAAADGIVAPTGLTVWPNPATRSARLAVPTTPGATLDVTVYDGLGRRVATVAEGIEATGTRYEAALVTDGWAPGVYLVRAVSHGADGASAVSLVRLTVTR